MAARVTEQAELAVAAADAVVLVVDATVGTQDVDEAVVKVLRRSGKPVVLAANKVDDQRTEAEAAAIVAAWLGRAVPGVGLARPGEWRPAGCGPGRDSGGAGFAGGC
mgnify:CR=1 FL=1